MDLAADNGRVLGHLTAGSAVVAGVRGGGQVGERHRPDRRLGDGHAVADHDAPEINRRMDQALHTRTVDVGLRTKGGGGLERGEEWGEDDSARGNNQATIESRDKISTTRHRTRMTTTTMARLTRRKEGTESRRDADLKSALVGALKLDDVGVDHRVGTGGAVRVGRRGANHLDAPLAGEEGGQVRADHRRKVCRRTKGRRKEAGVRLWTVGNLPQKIETKKINTKTKKKKYPHGGFPARRRQSLPPGRPA